MSAMRKLVPARLDDGCRSSRPIGFTETTSNVLPLGVCAMAVNDATRAAQITNADCLAISVLRTIRRWPGGSGRRSGQRDDIEIVRRTALTRIFANFAIFAPFAVKHT